MLISLTETTEHTSVLQMTQIFRNDLYFWSKTKEKINSKELMIYLANDNFMEVKKFSGYLGQKKKSNF